MLITCNKISNKKKASFRKEALGFAFEVYESVSLINKEHWNSIVNFGSEFLQIPFLTVLEKEHPDNMHFYYAIIYDKSSPIAIAYFQVIDFSSQSFGKIIEKEDSEFLCVIADYFKNRVSNHIIKNADKINMRLLICGNACISGEHGLTTIPSANKIKVIDSLVDVIYRISVTEKIRGKIAAILVKDFYSNSIEHSRELKDYKYHDFLVEPNMIVDINWDTFDEYLNAMSKKYRNRAKSIVKKGLGLKRKSFSAIDIKLNHNLIQQLYDNVHFKASFRMATLTSNYFAEMKNVLGDNFLFSAYYYQDIFVGFRSSFFLKNQVEAHFIGVDYDFNKEFEIYQNILYDYVKDAIEMKAQCLILGRTASEIKSTVGAQAHQLTCYIRHQNSFSNVILRPFVDYLKPAEWIPRNPFK